jgi:CRP-like cAMP-binding protein
MNAKELAESLVLMHTPPKLRSKEQVARLCLLTLKLKYFKEMQHEQRFDYLHRVACAVITCQEFHSGQVVVSYGDYAHTFFIVLKGELGVLIPKKKLKTTVEDHHVADDHSDNGCQEPAYTEVASLRSGDSFGELSLLRGLARSATVECKDSSVLAVLSIKEFKASLGILEEKKLNRKVEFLQSLPVFHEWTKSAISRMTYFLQTSVCTPGSVLFRERTKCNAVYIVQEGEFRLTQKAAIEQPRKGSLLLYGPRIAHNDRLFKPAMKKSLISKRPSLQVM